MWTYKQSTGALSHDGNLVATGYAGHGEGVNNHSMQNIQGAGPIPCGLYTVGQEFTHPHTGPISMRLNPDDSNQMYGRAGFLMHGDSTAHPGTASEGCIVIGRTARQLVSASQDRRLEVIA